ncbi:MAG: hypothetical protein ING69_12270 [Rhodocyclaceae bacterium]|jgi:hypothetical protein|nr:hypothetical protein [Rhodocyclaceae bacterium]MCA3083418.1 hypothetical protein [Rhodocyclaceae bacterium]
MKAVPIIVVGVAGVTAYEVFTAFEEMKKEANLFADTAGLNGGQKEAYRHAWASAEMTRRFGHDIAKHLGDAQEVLRKHNWDPVHLRDRNRDLWNNNRMDVGSLAPCA